METTHDREGILDMVLSSQPVPIDGEVLPPLSKRPPRSWIRRFVPLLLVPVVCAVGYYLGMLASAAVAPAKSSLDGFVLNGLHIDSQSLDLGEIWETPEHVARVTVKNVSSEPRTIIRFDQSCDCLGVEPQRMTIPPGQSAEVTFRLDLTHRQPYQLGLAQWPVSLQLHPVFEGDLAPTPGWNVRALVRSRVSLEAAQLAFGDRCTHTGPQVERKVRAMARQPLRRIEAVAVPDFATVRVEPIAGAQGEYFIIVAPRPDLPIGAFRSQIQIAAVTEDGIGHPCASLDVSGDMQPATRLVPSVILLGERTVGDEAQAEVTVFLPQNGWTVDRVEADSTETNLKLVGAGLDGGVQYRVDQRIARGGDHVIFVQFIIRKPDGQTEPVKLEVRYYGQKN